MALGRGRLLGPGCDRPPRPPPLPERITSRNSLLSKAVHDGEHWAGNTDNDKTAPTTPRTNRPEVSNGPKLPAVTEALRRCGQPPVTIRSVAPSGWSSSWGHVLGRQQCRGRGGCRPFKYDRVLCVFVFQSPPLPLHPLGRWRDEAMSRHWWGCGCVDCGDGIHRRIAGSPRLNLPSTSSLGAASGFADPKPSPWPCFVTFVEVNVASGAERRRFEKKKVETPRRVPREMSELAFQAPQKHDRPDSQIARGRGEGKQMAPQLPHSLAGRRPTVGARKHGQQVCPLVDGADCLEADPRRFKSGACRDHEHGAAPTRRCRRHPRRVA